RRPGRRPPSRRAYPAGSPDLHHLRHRNGRERLHPALEGRSRAHLSDDRVSRSGRSVTAPRSVLEPVTCLGCGCVCDDVSVQVSDGRIVNVTPDCPAARAWFGDGSVPEKVLRGGAAAKLEEAVADAASLLASSAGHVLVYLAPDLSTQAQRTAVALADLLRARVDSATSEPAAAG